MGLIAGGRSPGRSRRFFRTLFERGQLHKRVELLQQKIIAGEASTSLIRAPVFLILANIVLR